MILGSGLLQASGWTPTWLIRDEFTDTVTAGSVDGTAATPGPGTRTAIENDGAINTDGAALNISAQVSAAWGDLGLVYASVPRAAGVCVMFRVNFTTLYDCMIGVLASSSINVGGYSGVQHAMYVKNSGSVDLPNNVTAGVVNAMTFSPATYYTMALVLRSSGAVWYVFDNASNTWKTLFIFATGTSDSCFPAISNYRAVTKIDYLRVTQFPAPFDSDDGLATDTHSGIVAAGTTFAHEANCLIEYTLTTRPIADNVDVLFRAQDASNYWISRVDSSGDISLVEIVAGTPTTRGTAAGVVSSGHRVVVIADGTTIRVYSNNTLRITYASAPNFATATAGEVDALGTGGVISNVKTWPRTLSGTAASILDKASA